MKWSVLFLFILFFNACSTIKVKTDYNPDFAFNTLSAFAIVHKEHTGDDTLANDRIINAIKNNLTAKGYKATDKAVADYYVLFHTGVRSKTKIDTDYQHVGMYPYHYGYGYQGSAITPATRIYTYDEGKLLVDIVDPDQNKIIWRGIATDRIKAHETPKERTEYIDEVITSLLASFPNRATH